MVKLNKIYTRTGDDGNTGLVDGSRTSKNSFRIEAVGKVDEANSAIGLAASAIGAGGYSQSLYRIQNDMFDLGADLALPAPDGDFEPKEMALRIIQSQVDWLEAAIDAANEQLKPLDSFILPGGSEQSARVHLARAASRSAERTMVALSEVEPVNPIALAYINRLSDYLFVLARVLNDNGAGDVKWVPGANR